MKYYSEITKKTYDSEDECLEAEKAVADKTNQRKEAAAKVDTAMKAYLDAKKAYYDELDKFCKQFGAYHKTVTSSDLSDVYDMMTNKDLANIFKSVLDW